MCEKMNLTRADKTAVFALNKIVEESQKLLQCYEKLLFKYNFMDISLLMLKRELQINNSGHGRVLNLKQIEKFLIELNEIKTNLFEKIKDLSLNEMEQRYVTQNLRN